MTAAQAPQAPLPVTRDSEKSNLSDLGQRSGSIHSDLSIQPAAKAHVGLAPAPMHSVWSNSPDSLYEAEITTASRAKAFSPALMSIALSPFTDYEPNDSPCTFKPIVQTRPLTLKRGISITADSKEPSFGGSKKQEHHRRSSLGDGTASDPSAQPLHSILKGSNPLLSLGSRTTSSPRTIRGGINGLARPDRQNFISPEPAEIEKPPNAGLSYHPTASVVKRPQASHKSRYTPSSRRPTLPAASSSSINDGIVSDFPLPPTSTTFSTFASSTSLPYAPAVERRPSRRDARTLVSGITSPSLLAYTTPESPSMGHPNLGDIMLSGFEDGNESGGMDESPVLGRNDSIKIGAASYARMKNRKSRDLSEDTSSSSHKRRSLKRDAPVPSITITGTPSADNLKSLNRRLSRAAAQIKSSASASAFQSSSINRPLNDEPEWMPLSQMALERTQPDYRSPTYSIYGMYDDIATPKLAHFPPSSVDPIQGDKGRRGNTTTLSTIYNGYGLEKTDEDIGGSFAKEVGASLGKIGVV